MGVTLQVLRHPDHNVSSDNLVLYWAHHEKLVCIDQKITFMGGEKNRRLSSMSRWQQLSKVGSMSLAAMAR